MLMKLFVFLVLFIPSIASADTAKSEAAARQVVESVMERAAGGNYVGAIEIIAKYSPVMQQSQDKIIGMQIKVERDKSLASFGVPVSYEFVREVKPSASLWRLYYLEKGTIGSAAWIFTLYKAKEGWVVNSFSMKDDLDILFDGPQ